MWIRCGERGECEGGERGVCVRDLECAVGDLCDVIGVVLVLLVVCVDFCV